MICTHCEYKDGSHWEGDHYICVDGDAGKFWELPIKMERRVRRDWEDTGERKATLYGCPVCNKTFIEE